MDLILKNDTYKYQLRYYEKDANDSLKVLSILNFMQDVATNHAEANGFGPSAIFKKNLTWFVLKYKLVIYKHLENAEEIEIKTESRGVSKLFAYRDFYFYHNGELFAKAGSLWGLIDIENKKMVKPLDYLQNINIYEKREDDLTFDKIPNIEEFDTQKEYNIRYDDLDINKHVNNASYISWALETFDFDFRKTHYLKSMDINFKKDIATSDNIISKMSYDAQSQTSIHQIFAKSTNDELCTMQIIWGNIKP